VGVTLSVVEVALVPGEVLDAGVADAALLE
jgi:hypothetical protein